jgi:CRP-like cAMP-binding protein
MRTFHDTVSATRPSGTTVRSRSINPSENHLLGMLPAEDQARVFPLLEPVTLTLGEVLCEPSVSSRYIHFPTDSIVSLLYVMENGASAEIAAVGNDGMVGIARFMGGGSTTSRAVVQSAGDGYRLSGREFEAEINRHGALLGLMLRYSQVLVTQMAQTAVCNCHHAIDQQLCRWLLLSLDRLPGSELVITQEMIANRLGVRREGVTQAAGKLQELGVIDYRRGHITVLDRAALEELSCECYSVVKQESDRLLPWGPTRRLMRSERDDGRTARDPSSAAPGNGAAIDLHQIAHNRHIAAAAAHRNAVVR